MIQFKFNTFNDWYKHNITDTNIFDVDQTVHAWNVYKSNDWMKYSNKQQREKFLVVKRVSTIRKIKSISENYENNYPNGMYVITDYAPNWILFVYPRAKYNFLGNKYSGLFADHYSFVHNIRGSKGKVNQFHETTYVPYNDDTNKDGSKGSRLDSKEKLWFRDGQPIPFEGYETEFMSNLGGTAQRAVIDMLRVHWTHFENLSGGTKRSAAAAPSPHREPKRSRASNRFEEKWRKYKIDRAFAFSVKVGDVHYVTVSIYDKANEPEYVERLAFRFTMKRLDSRTVRKKLVEYVESLP